jgi:hypothetical protein
MGSLTWGGFALAKMKSEGRDINDAVGETDSLAKLGNSAGFKDIKINLRCKPSS